LAANRPDQPDTVMRRSSRRLWLFPLPAVALYGVFFVLPALRTLWYAFFNWEGAGSEPAWVGLETFKTKVADDTVFKQSAYVSVKFMLLVVVFQTLLALLYAVHLTRTTKPTIFLRALYFLPTILSSTAVAFIWSFVYDPANGLAQSVLNKVGLSSYHPAMLGSNRTALYMLVIAQVWFHAGQMMVVFVAGLQQVPKDYTEAAAIDGATRSQVFRKVTWPLLGPATAIVVAYTSLQAFRSFDLVYNMTEGGPSNATRVLGFHIYQTAFQGSHYGEAATESVLFMVIIAVVTFLQRRVLRFTKADLKGVAS
jgi:raffinose/stachyose/melibiose transport system permease protein